MSTQPLPPGHTRPAVLPPCRHCHVDSFGHEPHCPNADCTGAWRCPATTHTPNCYARLHQNEDAR